MATKYLKVKTLNEIENILDSIDTKEYSLVNYVWVEYGFYPVYFNELFKKFFDDCKGYKIGFCFPGHEIFYENKVDILVTLENFIDTRKTYQNNRETDLLLNNFKYYPDRGVAFWYTLRNFDEDLYWDLISKYKFRNILYPIGKEIPWENGLFGPNPGFKYAEGIDGVWYLPSCKWYERGSVAWDLDLWNSDFKESDEYLKLKNYNTFFVKNTWKTRNFRSSNINDFLVGLEGNSGSFDIGSVDYELYLKISQFHIENKINLVIFNDLVKFPAIESEYIHYVNMEGFLDVRLLLSIVNNSKNFITTGTSPSDLANYYCKSINVVLLGDDIVFSRTTFIDEVQKIKNKKIFKYHKNHKNLDDMLLFLKENS